MGEMSYDAIITGDTPRGGGWNNLTRGILDATNLDETWETWDTGKNSPEVIILPQPEESTTLTGVRLETEDEDHNFSYGRRYVGILIKKTVTVEP
jgi:hypothetical protein